MAPRSYEHKDAFIWGPIWGWDIEKSLENLPIYSIIWSTDKKFLSFKKSVNWSDNPVHSDRNRSQIQD